MQTKNAVLHAMSSCVTVYVKLINRRYIHRRTRCLHRLRDITDAFIITSLNASRSHSCQTHTHQRKWDNTNRGALCIFCIIPETTKNTIRIICSPFISTIVARQNRRFWRRKWQMQLRRTNCRNSRSKCTKKVSNCIYCAHVAQWVTCVRNQNIGAHVYFA
jgi:hypothetical protein